MFYSFQLVHSLWQAATLLPRLRDSQRSLRQRIESLLEISYQESTMASLPRVWTLCLTNLVGIIIIKPVIIILTTGGTASTSMAEATLVATKVWEQEVVVATS